MSDSGYTKEDARRDKTEDMLNRITELERENDVLRKGGVNARADAHLAKEGRAALAKQLQECHITNTALNERIDQLTEACRSGNEAIERLRGELKTVTEGSEFEARVLQEYKAQAERQNADHARLVARFDILAGLFRLWELEEGQE